MSYLKFSNICLAISGLLVLASLVLLINPGPRLSVEFTGGTMMELDLPEGKTQQDLMNAINAFRKDEKALNETAIASTKTGTLLVRLPTLTNEEHTALFAHLQSVLGPVTELQYTTIGPTVGSSLQKRSLFALLLAVVAIIVYLAFAFRKMPRHLSPWTFGIAAVLGLLHDVIITVAIFTILSHYTAFQMDTLFATALLSNMGYSVSDKVVIFDRIRDNVIMQPRGDFSQIVTQSIKQSLTRTLSTGAGALIMLLSLFIFGAESIRWFMLALIIGTVIGTYSSFCVATPLVVLWKNWKKN